jgi:uncharacterized BrkB/YihY/UPF0761 family membrane protein
MKKLCYLLLVSSLTFFLFLLVTSLLLYLNNGKEVAISFLDFYGIRWYSLVPLAFTVAGLTLLIKEVKPEKARKKKRQ